MMLDPTPAKAKSRHPLWGLWTKSLVVGCLLSSAAMLAQPSPAHARNGMNGFMAGAILGGAFRGFGPPQASRGYRTGRTVRSSRSGRRSRGKQIEEVKKEEILRTEPASTAAAGGAAATAATTTTAASANAGSGASAAAGTAAATEGRGNGSRSSRRNGRRGGGSLETVNGLE
jgi:hypothetical protein